MVEKIYDLAAYPEIQRPTLGMSVASDALNAANRLLWKRGIPLRLLLLAPADEIGNQIVSCMLEEYSTGPKLYAESKDAPAA